MIDNFVEVQGVAWKILKPGIFPADLRKIGEVFAINTHRKKLYNGLVCACKLLKSAGCTRVFVDGSFVSMKPLPGDFDACWDPVGVDEKILDPIFWNFENNRAAQKSKFCGEFFPANMIESGTRLPFLDFFQEIGKNKLKKGIILLELSSDPLLQKET